MPAGRPTKYQEQYNQLAFNYCKLGADDAKLAEFFEVDERTINNWKADYPEFFQSIKKGKDLFDNERVKGALIHSALGYSHDAEKILVCDKAIVREKYTEHYPPNPTSIIFWLKNRDKENWKDKQEMEHSGGVTITSNVFPKKH